MRIHPLASSVVFLATMSWLGIASAQPVVNSTNGSWIHTQSVDISGMRLGTKSPATPLLWDDGEGKPTQDPQAVLTSGWTESWSGPNHPVRPSWRLQYRPGSFRGVAQAHDHSATFVVGGHWNDASDMGRNVALTKAAASSQNQWYASWYVRLNPAWPTSTPEDCYTDRNFENYKDYVFQDGTASYTSQFNYSACTSCIARSLPQIDPGPQQLCGGQVYDVLEPRPSELFSWQHRQILLRQSPGVYQAFSHDGTVSTHTLDVSCPSAGELVPWQIRSFTVGGFMKHGDSNTGQDPYVYPRIHPINNVADPEWFTWSPRGSGDEYYVKFRSGAIDQDTSEDPWILVEPNRVWIDGADAPRGSVAGGGLAEGEWDYGDFDGLGFPTVYARLPAGITPRNPEQHGDCMVMLTDSRTGPQGGEGNGRTHNSAFRYFDDVYIDTTWSRVVLANHVDYDQATIVEPQIPTAWSDESITVDVNLGMLPDCQTAYLFVFDSANTRNATGFAVDVGCATECSDGVDNDADGAADHPADTGCDSADDDDETDCGDGVCEGGEDPGACASDCPAGGTGGASGSGGGAAGGSGSAGMGGAAGDSGVGGAAGSDPTVGAPEDSGGCGCRSAGVPRAFPIAGAVSLAFLALRRHLVSPRKRCHQK